MLSNTNAPERGVIWKTSNASACIPGGRPSLLAMAEGFVLSSENSLSVIQYPVPLEGAPPAGTTFTSLSVMSNEIATGEVLPELT